MGTWDWAIMLVIVGTFAAVTEEIIKRAEERMTKRLERMQDQLYGICKKIGVDPINPSGW